MPSDVNASIPMCRCGCGGRAVFLVTQRKNAYYVDGSWRDEVCEDEPCCALVEGYLRECAVEMGYDHTANRI